MSRFLAVAVLLVPSPLFAADEKPAAGIPVAGVGVVSTSQKVIFVPAKGGGVEAVDLATGKQIWVNKDAVKLAGASEKMVFAWNGNAKKANEFNLVTIDAATGKTLGKSDAITLPDWAVTGAQWGRTFRTAARPDGDGVMVFWQAGAFYAGGARPTPEIEEAARKSESGMAHIDINSGKVSPAKGKPKEEDFSTGPNAGVENKVGELEFRVEEAPPAGDAFGKTKVTLTVVRGEKVVWQRELAGNPFNPPPP